MRSMNVKRAPAGLSQRRYLKPDTLPGRRPLKTAARRLDLDLARLWLEPGGKIDPKLGAEIEGSSSQTHSNVPSWGEKW